MLLNILQPQGSFLHKESSSLKCQWCPRRKRGARSAAVTDVRSGIQPLVGGVTDVRSSIQPVVGGVGGQLSQLLCLLGGKLQCMFYVVSQTFPVEMSSRVAHGGCLLSNTALQWLPSIP